MRKVINYLIVGLFSFVLFVVLYLCGAIPDIIFNEDELAGIFFIVEIILTLSVVCFYPFIRKHICKRFEIIDSAFDLSVFISLIVYLFVSYQTIDSFVNLLEVDNSGKFMANFLLGLGVFISWGITLAGCIIIALEIIVMEYIIPFIKNS